MSICCSSSKEVLKLVKALGVEKAKSVSINIEATKVVEVVVTYYGTIAQVSALNDFVQGYRLDTDSIVVEKYNLVKDDK